MESSTTPLTHLYTQMMRFAILLYAVMLGVAGWGEAAQGQPMPSMQTTFDGCTDNFVAQTRSLLDIELRALAPELKGPSPESWELAIACTPKTVQLDIRPSDQPSSEPPLLTRDIELAALPERGQPRLVALALTEMLAQAHRTYVQTPPESQPSSSPATLPGHGITTTPEPIPPPPRLDLGLNVGVVGFSGSGLFYGLEASMDWWPDRNAPFMARLGLDAAGGQQTYDLGSVRGGWLALAPQLVGHLPLRSGLALELVGGGRIGWALLQGRSTEANTEEGQVQGLWAGPLLGTGLDWRRQARLGVEVGYAPLGLRGAIDDRDDVRIDGVWLRLGVGAVW
ncbi:MAG: hypothetical protein AAFX99_15465 [Myxococcota bacterium]